MGLSNDLSCEAGSFSCCLNPHGFFQSEILKFYIPTLEPWVVWSVSLPHCSSQLSTCKCGTACSTSYHLAGLPAATSFAPVLQPPPCHESFPPWLPFFIPPTSLDECFSLTPWLWDFHTVRFSVSSGCILFLNLLLSLFWLCEEAQCVYLCLCLGRKSDFVYLFKELAPGFIDP